MVTPRNWSEAIGPIAFYLVLYSLIVLISFTGDHLLGLPRRSNLAHYGIALADTLIHGVISAISFIMIVVLQMYTINISRYIHWPIIRDIILCAILASAIDLDHVIAARSLSIKVSFTIVICLKLFISFIISEFDFTS